MSLNADNTFLIYFNPGNWSELKKFKFFVDKPYERNHFLNKGLQTSLSHLDKCENLVKLANNLIKGIDIDEQELNDRGFTSATYSKMVAALFETIVCELFSVLDGVNLSIFGLFKGVEKIQRKSVEKMFKRAFKNDYGEPFPKEVNSVLSKAYHKWYMDLKEMRVEFTHGEVGSVNKVDDRIDYFHTSLSDSNVIHDIVSIINSHTENVVNLINEIFGYFYSQLEGVTKEIPCGFYQGRVYQRTVGPEVNLTFNSGKCLSKIWFDENQIFKCPMRTQCGAYENAGEKA